MLLADPSVPVMEQAAANARSYGRPRRPGRWRIWGPLWRNSPHSSANPDCALWRGTPTEAALNPDLLEASNMAIPGVAICLNVLVGVLNSPTPLPTTSSG